jgi:hypothetical protein
MKNQDISGLAFHLSTFTVLLEYEVISPPVSKLKHLKFVPDFHLFSHATCKTLIHFSDKDK